MGTKTGREAHNAKAWQDLVRILSEQFQEAEKGCLWGTFGVSFTVEAGTVRTVKKVVDSTLRDFAPVDGKNGAG